MIIKRLIQFGTEIAGGSGYQEQENGLARLMTIAETRYLLYK